MGVQRELFLCTVALYREKETKIVADTSHYNEVEFCKMNFITLSFVFNNGPCMLMALSYYNDSFSNKSNCSITIFNNG